MDKTATGVQVEPKESQMDKQLKLLRMASKTLQGTISDFEQHLKCVLRCEPVSEARETDDAENLVTHANAIRIATGEILASNEALLVLRDRLEV